MPFLRKVFCTFHDILTGGKVVWYEKDYNDCRDGNNHSGPHPEVVAHFDVVKKAVENPDNITEDRDYTNRICYYGWFSLGKDYPLQPHMKVVARNNKWEKKTIITAYACDYAGSKEKQIPWTK